MSPPVRSAQVALDHSAFIRAIGAIIKREIGTRLQDIANDGLDCGFDEDCGGIWAFHGETIEGSEVSGLSVGPWKMSVESNSDIGGLAWEASEGSKDSVGTIWYFEVRICGSGQLVLKNRLRLT